MLFYLDNLQIIGKSVSLHCVFHSIRFKVNKGWSKALLLFLCPYLSCLSYFEYTTKNSDAIRVGYRHYHSHIPSLCRPDSDAIFIHYFLVRKFTYLRPSHASKSANIPQSAFSIAALINGSIISYPSPVG